MENKAKKTLKHTARLYLWIKTNANNKNVWNMDELEYEKSK